eukprot:6178787-Pleurochrysis_carterae.AAC.3
MGGGEVRLRGGVREREGAWGFYEGSRGKGTCACARKHATTHTHTHTINRAHLKTSPCSWHAAHLDVHWFEKAQTPNEAFCHATPPEPSLVCPSAEQLWCVAGRLDVHVHVGLPSAPQRARLIESMLSNTACDETIDVAAIVAATDGFSLSQLSALHREAAMAALREDMYAASVNARHFDEALAQFQCKSRQCRRAA